MFTPYLASQLSFPRIIDIPLETCVAALENELRTGQHTDLYISRSLLRGPIQHDRDTGTYRIEVRLARGPLRPLLPMRLHIDRWSAPAARTALELIPAARVRPAAAYFRAGHLLLDALTRRLANFIDLNDLQREDRLAAAAALSTPNTSLGRHHERHDTPHPQPRRRRTGQRADLLAGPRAVLSAPVNG